MCLSVTGLTTYRPSDLSISWDARWWLKSAQTHRHGKPHSKPSEETFSSQCKLFTFPETTSAFQNVHRNTTACVAWSQTHTLHALYLATLQWKLDRSPGAAESSGVQLKASHHKALTCYPPTDLMISSLTKTVYMPTKEKKIPKSSDPKLFSFSPISIGFSHKLAVILFHRASSVSRHRRFLHQY
jgi:hypothetical protein